MTNREIPVLLLTGYLGSGKTTLVNHILQNEKGYKFAVIVNDIGEVNIDAALIEKGGVVGKRDESLIALQNGCICCTLKMDLVQQLDEIASMERFDYIVIEASGICEPEPIARTICSIPYMDSKYSRHGVARLDCVVTVVDALRFQSEFSCGERLVQPDLDEDDVENLLIQQIEFCNLVILNKVSEITQKEKCRIKEIILNLRPGVKILETDYADVEIDDIIGTGLFNFDSVVTAAGWIKGVEAPSSPEEEAEALARTHHEEHDHNGHHHDHGHDEDHDDYEHHHEHHHHHHGHDHSEGEAEEYGISTFVYYRRPPIDINRFDHFIATRWPKSVIRAKGLIYFSNETHMSYIFEQAGVQKKLTQSGQWYATAPEEELERMKREDPALMRDWDTVYGDRMVKIVFIGQNMDKETITRDLDNCLA